MKKQQPARIYTLQDPRDLQVRFVGCSRTTAERLATYNPMYKTNGPAAEWRKELHNLGLRPMVTIVVGVGEDWREKLVHWTEVYRKAGANLLENKWTDPEYEGTPRREQQTVASLRAENEALKRELTMLRRGA